MTGLLVIAELEAFRSVLRNAGADDGEKITLWCRSTISNALHRAGPTQKMKIAAEQAWADADAFASLLQTRGLQDATTQRARALVSLEGLIAEIRASRSGADESARG